MFSLNKFMLKVVVFILFLFTGAVFSSLDLHTMNDEGYIFNSGDTRYFPALHIDTLGFRYEELVPFNWRRWQPARITMQNADGSYVFRDVPAETRGRGNSTWIVGVIDGKVPFRVRFDVPIQMLDSGHAATNWTVIANHLDRSMFRQYAAYYLGNLLSESHENAGYFSPSHAFIDVYINGRYWGVYMLSDQVNEVTPGRSDLSFSSDPNFNEFMLELNEYGHRQDSPCITINGRRHSIRYPSDSLLTDEHMDYLYNFLTDVDSSIRNMEFEEIVRLTDMDSLVDFYIVSEWFQNHDISHGSFMHIRRDNYGNPRLYSGPLWDFDVPAFSAVILEAPMHTFHTVHNIWYGYLLRMPEFQNEIARRWYEIREREILQTLNMIREHAMKNENAFERNFERFPILGTEMFGTPPRLVELETFMEHVDFLLYFLETRKAFFDSMFLTEYPLSVDFAVSTALGGEFSTYGWISDGTNGSLLLGYDLQLLIGDYEAHFVIRLDSYTNERVGQIGVDVYNRWLENISSVDIPLYASDFQQNQQRTFTIPFTSKAFVPFYEFRILTAEGTFLVAEDVYITRTAGFLP